MTRLFSLFAAFVLFGHTASAQIRSVFNSVAVAPPAPQGPHVRASLVAERSAFVPGDTVWLALRMEMDPEWHTYWINPGDSGMPTSLAWTLPAGFEAGEALWPVPTRAIEAEILVSHAYKGTVHILVPIRTPASAATDASFDLALRADWLECKEACVPGSATLSISLRSAADAIAPETDFAPFRRQIPGAAEGWTAHWVQSGGDLVLELAPPSGGMPPEGRLDFFPKDELLWELLPGFSVERGADMLRVRGKLADQAKIPDTVRGILAHATDAMAPGSTRAIEIAATRPGVAPPPSVEAPRNLAVALLGALVAGVMINLLPCIFPVLGLKVSSFVEQAQGDPADVKKHALVFAAGILVSLWILGGLVGLLGAAWGGQFQDPRVVIALLLGLTFFTMNLFGLFEMGNRLTTVGGSLAGKQGYAGSFFQGILLTVIGTPCTGPVLAGMIGWMLGQPLWIAFLAFTSMGIGIALPYVALAFSPRLLEKLPRPGMWMVTFKQGSAFVMVLFLWVMLWVLTKQVPATVLTRVVGAMLMVCFAAWVLGTWGSPERAAKVRRIALAAALSLLAFAGYLGFSYTLPATEIDAGLQARVENGDPLRWDELSPEVAAELLEQGVPVHYQPFSPELLDRLRKEGRPVFVDFTAEWCTICKINKFRALHKEEVLRAFQDKGVVTLRADWTGKDQTIADFLAAFGRRGVPVYPLYPAGGGEAELLPESLSVGLLLETLSGM